MAAYRRRTPILVDGFTFLRYASSVAGPCLLAGEVFVPLCSLDPFMTRSKGHPPSLSVGDLSAHGTLSAPHRVPFKWATFQLMELCELLITYNSLRG
jgi:hypothetical protein